MATKESTAGSLVHIELATEDTAATRAFFEGVFGWTFEHDEELDYTTWRTPDPPFGGLVDPGATPFEVPPVLPYIAVDDVETAGEAIVEAGGDLLLDAMEIPEVGALTAFREPGGIVEAVWEDRGGMSGEETPPFTDDPGVGSITHFELYSESPDATRSFHDTAFDWTFETLAGGGYTMIHPPTPPAGGLMPGSDELPSGTLLYLLVEDATTAVEAIEDAGGSIRREPYDVEGWGTMTVFEAPGGLLLATWEAADATDDPVADVDRAPST